MNARILITTAMQETWPLQSDQVLFLGEWARRYNLRQNWSKFDWIVVPYHWNNREKLYKDYGYLEIIYENCLILLTRKLNSIHKVNYSSKYWRILLGPWLAYFIQILYDRWFMLDFTIRNYSIKEVRVINRLDGEGVPNDMAQFIKYIVDDDWNENIYAQIMRYLPININIVELERSNRGVDKEDKSPIKKLSIQFKQNLINTYNKIVSVLFKKSKYFIFNSYLNLGQLIYLQLCLKQFPKLWRSTGAPEVVHSEQLRKWTLHEAPEIECSKNNFYQILLKLIPKNIPKLYLEGYNIIDKHVEKYDWPANPKVIFTSNGYSEDDAFKAWAAGKVENGSSMIIAQHGGNIGMALWGFEEDHQISISNKFFSWGWTSKENNQVVPLGIIKNFGSKSKFNPTGSALLVGLSMPRYSYHMYSAPVASEQWLSYFEDQTIFIDHLPKEIKEKLVVRLSPNDYGLSQLDRWRSRYTEIKIDKGKQPIRRLVNQCRIFISTYNATTYLESISLNIPTIIFWNELHWEIRESVKEHFSKLKAVGIFHETPESAALHLTTVWENISLWWDSPTLQSVRNEFCKEFAHLPENPIELMAAKIKET